MFPLVVDLRGRTVVVIGAGEVGVRKAAQLLAAGAEVRLVSEAVLAAVPEGVELEVRPYVYGDLDDVYLAVAATGDGAVNDRIVAEAGERHVLLNVVDDVARSNFYFTAVHRDGDVTVSVSTAGASPALAQWVRDRVTAVLPSHLGEVARQLRRERDAIHRGGESTEHRPWAVRVQELIDAAQQIR